MANSSQLSLRGWILAIGLAGILTGVLGAMRNYSLVLDPESFFLVRSPDAPAITEKAPVRLATDRFGENLAELTIPSQTSEWLNYRSRPVITATAVLEPSAKVRLSAPRATRENLDSLFATAPKVKASEPLAAPATALVHSVAHPHDLLEQPTFASRNAIASIDWKKPSDQWPAPTQLIADLIQLQRLAEENHLAAVSDWAKATLQAAESLSQSSCRDASAAEKMEQLQELAIQAIQANAQHVQLDEVIQGQTRVAHSIVRRVAVWKAIWVCLATPKQSTFGATRPAFEMDRLLSSIDRLQQELAATGDTAGWEEYLLFDELRRLSVGDEADVQMASATAQVLLNRITSKNVDSVQRRFLDSESVRELAECLQPLAVSPVDYQTLLLDLERLEGDAEHRSRETIINAMQALRFAYDSNQISVSQAIDTYYRNANVRIAVSEKLINRLLPANKTVQRPVRQTILGAETRGNSDVKTTLHVRLNPDPNAWNVILDLDGKIQSNTRSSRGPATFFNSSLADVSTSRSLRITSQGIQIQGSQADVQSQDSLRSMQTNYDGLPFVGEMVRYLAQKEFKEKRGPARKLMQRSIAAQTDTEFDKQLDLKLEEIEKSFEKKLIGPLRNLNLNPLIMDLQTTADRLIARYRLASDNALGANTPRPQAPADSLLSVQIHQSAMNNGFSQLGLSDRDWSLLELAQNLALQFGQEPVETLSSDVPTDVRVRFDGDRPVLVEFREGRLQLTLRFASLSRPGRIELNDFVIRTTYLPAVSGLQAELVLDGPPSIGGQLSMGEKIPLRAIFGKVFAARSTIPMVTPQLLQDPRTNGLAISQLILEENWLAVAISEEDSPHVSHLHSQQIVR